MAGLDKLYAPYKKGDHHSPGDDAVHKTRLLTNRSCAPLLHLQLLLPIPATLLPWATPRVCEATYSNKQKYW